MKPYDQARTGVVLRARQLRRDSTDAEKHLWTALRSAFPNRKWRRQMPVGPYFADFACFAEKLIIELDGGQHMASADYDEVRSRYLRTNGYRVLRFWNNDVLENIDGMLAQISLSLGRGREQRQLRKGEDDDPHASSSPSRAFGAHPSPGGRGRTATRP